MSIKQIYIIICLSRYLPNLFVALNVQTTTYTNFENILKTILWVAREWANVKFINMRKTFIQKVSKYMYGLVPVRRMKYSWKRIITIPADA